MPATPARSRAQPPRRREAAAAPPAVPDRVGMGTRLRAIRRERGLTLKALAQRSGVALSTLSKMELGQVSVSYEKFAAVATALEVDIARLFDPRATAAPGKRPTVVRSTLQDAPVYDSPTYSQRMLAAGYPAKHMAPFHVRVVSRRRDEFPDFVRHPGQEFLMVLSGAIRIEFETGESVLLKRLESAYFDSGTGHIYLSVGRGDAEIVVVMA